MIGVEKKEKAFATKRTPFQIHVASVSHIKAALVRVLRFVDDYLRRGFVHLKLGAHFLDL